jgi:uncharacterized protein with NRDE domain
MCLVALALDAHPRFPLVLAANRDEFFARPSSPMDWWTPDGDTRAVLAGRDLQAGGSWLGLTATGRLAVVTNVRRPALPVPGAPSRGALVLRWLQADTSTEAFAASVADARFASFNLLALDLARRDAAWLGSAQREPQPLRAGVHGLSNAALDTPWPKVQTLKQRLGDHLASATSAVALTDALLSALADPSEADDDVLPDTGVPPEWERLLSAAFIHTPDGRYGTRCSTVLVVERDGSGGLTAHLRERSFSPDGGSAGERGFTLPHWPPVPASHPMAPAVGAAPGQH